jgi:tetratricopeptide (TPR) repeat protein
LRLHQTSEAVIVFLQVKKLNPGSARSHYNLALSQFQAGRYRDAVATLNSVPSSAFDPDMLDLLADTCERLADTPTAAEALQKAIMLQPDNPRPYVRFADLCLAHNSFQAGIDMLNAGINRAPNAASLYLARGILRVQLAQMSAAEEDFTRAEMLDPNSHYAGVLQQMTKLQENKLDSAADDLRKRIKKQPNNAYLQYLLAETLIRSGAPIDGPEFSQAISAAKTAVQLQPSLGLARDVLGRLYLQQGNLEDAVEQSRRAYANDPTDQTALYHLIRALKSAGRTSEVAELTKQLAKLRQASERKESDQRRYSIVVGAAGK